MSVLSSLLKLMLLILCGAAIYYIFFKGEYTNFMTTISEEKYEPDQDERPNKPSKTSKSEICIGSMCISEAYTKDMISNMDRTSKRKLMSMLLQ